MGPLRFWLCGAALALGSLARATPAVAPPMPVAASPQTPCPLQPVPRASGLRAQAVTFGWRPLLPAAQAQLPASTAHPDPIAGTLLWPTAPHAPLPAVVLLHGSGGNQCDLYGAARGLAAQGYVALTLTQPDNRSASSETSGAEALAGALAFLASPENPALAWTRPDDVALIGHSEGAGVVSLAQGLPGFGAVRAIVALDNLRRWLVGDPGSAVRSCARPPSGEVTPRVPALGLAKDGPCTATGDTDPTVKLSGWAAWQAHGIPAAELVPAGYGHLTFTDRNATPAALAWQVGLMAAWLDRWLKADPDALKALSCQAHAPLAAALSAHYRSALALPGQPVTRDLRATLQACP